MAIDQEVTADDGWFTNADHEFDFEVYQRDDTTRQDITDWPLLFLVKRHPKDADAAAVITKSTADSPSDITITDASQGEVTVAVLAADTRRLPAQRYYFELKRIQLGEYTPLTVGTAVLRQSLHRT